jgi:crotonobetainyl-CoA:carnitine CoA-transferase CaiB-like acyl-CoA transferase
MAGVLSGLRVVEQGTFITGPCAGMMLADLGADVIKLESPGGDPYRSFKGGIYSAHFQAYNRNKRSLALDLKQAGDRELFHALIASADVYIQNFRPGAAGRVGADYATLSAIQPRLVYGSISGFGPDGPYVDRPVYDSVAQAMSGFLSVAIDPAEPRFVGPALADAITGLYAALGVMGALIERGRTGVGKHVEISMLEAMMHFAVEPFMGYFALQEAPTGVDRPRLAQAFISRCGDGKLIAFHLSSIEKFWTALVEAIEAPELAHDPRFVARQDRIDNYEALSDAFNAIFARRDRADWIKRLSAFDAPFAPVYTIPEAIEDVQVKHLGLIAPVVERREGAERTVRPPFRFDGASVRQVRAAPGLNEHGAAMKEKLRNAPGQWPAR